MGYGSVGVVPRGPLAETVGVARGGEGTERPWCGAVNKIQAARQRGRPSNGDCDKHDSGMGP